MNALTGFLTGSHTFVNSEWEKKLILSMAEEMLSVKSVNFLKEHITPLQPGVNVRGIKAMKNDKRTSEKFTILFNHRLDSYTNYKLFIQWMDNLWAKRQDFKVIITDVSAKSETGLHGIQEHLNRPYLEVRASLDKKDYYTLLWQVDAGVLMHKSWGAWSMSGLDLMAAGKPIISTYDRAFPEMLGEPYPFYFTPGDESSFQSALGKAMADKKAYSEASVQLQDRAIKLFDWDVMAAKWLDGIEKYGDCEFSNEASERKLDLVEYVKKQGIVTKKQLVQWVGGEVSYTRRRRFLQDNGIKDDPDTPLCEYSFGMTQKRFF
jgi:glycosyltransferase involved in cell wall biosynthesis